MLKVREINAKSILNKSKIFDYCLNPYTGCQHNCVYCYARLFMRRYTGHKEEWGKFVDAKVNAPEVLKKQLIRARRGTVWVSSVCDPYQPLEKKYNLTRRCLEQLIPYQFPVNIQTKSGLVLKDLDIFRQFEKIEVGLTIATDDEKIAKLFEPMASPIRGRLDALEMLHSKGIRTFVFIGPLLPGNPENLIERIDGIANYVIIDRMNYINTLGRFYRRHDLEEASTDRFFNEIRDRLSNELAKRKLKFKVVF
jgi:DNA repair photolyase